MGKVSEIEAPSSSDILGDDKFEHLVADWLLGRRRKKAIMLRRQLLRQ